MKLRHLPLAAALLAVPAVAQPASAPRPLTADEHTTLRCAAAFAIISAGQAHGDPTTAQYPPLAQRGRQFFVVAAAQLMDDAGLDEAGIKAAAEAEAGALRKDGVAPVMPFCLKALDSVLAPKP